MVSTEMKKRSHTKSSKKGVFVVCEHSVTYRSVLVILGEFNIGARLNAKLGLVFLHDSSGI